MQNKQRYFTAGATIAAAAVTAHLMQRDAGTPPDQSPGIATAGFTPVVSGLTAPTPPRVENEVTLVAIAPAAEAPKEIAPQIEAAPELVAKPEILRVPVETKPVEIALARSTERPVGSAETNVEKLIDFPTPPAEVLVPGPLPQSGKHLAKRITAAESLTPDLSQQPERNQFGLTCGPILSAAPVVEGLINLILTAPCRSDETIIVRHGALSFTDRTDKMGTYQMTVPAMATPARFVVTFETGDAIETEIDVGDVSDLERVALVSSPDSGLQIHALEFGAGYGEDGHIWAENPGNAALGAVDGKGYMIRLGNQDMPDAVISEVYTFPRSSYEESGTVRLSVEAEVTPENCGTDVTGVTIEPESTGVPIARSLEVAMPDCDAVGEYLVLKNLLRDLRIASN